MLKETGCPGGSPKCVRRAAAAQARRPSRGRPDLNTDSRTVRSQQEGRSLPIDVPSKTRFYDSGLKTTDPNLRTRLEFVNDRIHSVLQRCGRERSQVTLVAVTKKFSAALIREGYYLGLRDFGENYVQEFAGKRPELQDLTDARFHLIGHLQSNKSNLATDLFHVIHTIDSAKLIERLDRSCASSGRHLKALIEVKLSDEEAKSGTSP